MTDEPGWHSVQQDVLLTLDPNDLEEPHAERLLGDDIVAAAQIQKVDLAPHLRGAERGQAAAERARAAAAAVPLSFWLLLFSVFLFLSLAFVKRFAELDALRRQQGLRAAGRGYHVEDLPVLQSLGTAAGYLSVLVLALYIEYAYDLFQPRDGVLYAANQTMFLIGMLCFLTVIAGLMRAGIVPETVCVECADISARLQRA